jgi:TolB protein
LRLGTGLTSTISALAFFAVAACSDDPASPTTASALISVSTVGEDVDRNGYELVVSDGRTVAIPVPDTTIRIELARGPKSLRINGIARNCRAPTNPVQVSITGSESRISITVTCETRQIAYTDDRDGDYEIYVSGLNGHPATQLTNNTAFDGIPSWSPDGERIAFASERDGASEIYVMNADGSAVQRLTHDTIRDVTPRWSPDGTRILFQSYRAGASQLFVMRGDGSDVRQITFAPDTAGRAAWSADGSLIGYSVWRGPNVGNYIYTVRPDGTEKRQITFARPLDAYPRQDLDPAWSPDGKRIAFTNNANIYPELSVMNADGTDFVQLSHDGANGFVIGPVWSLDGKRIAYMRHYAGINSIWLWDVAANTAKPFVSGPKSVSGVSWRP